MKFNAYLSLLFCDILKSESLLRVRVSGDSMTPFIRDGETVTLMEATAYRPGTLILYTTSDKHLTLHRVIYSKRNQRGLLSFQTKGDATSYFDPPISKNMILGKVIEIEKTKPLLGHTLIRMDSYFWRVISQLIVIKTLIRNHKFYALTRPYLNPQIITLYRTLRARLTT